MWPHTDLLNLLGIIHPIVQAPTSGFGGPALVDAVSNAGALGSLGCRALRNQAAYEEIQEIRQATNRAFNLNFFAHSAPRMDADVARRMRERLTAYYDEFDLSSAFGAAALGGAAVWDAQSWHLGDDPR
jgi:nitronate monooxygenase